MKPYSDSVKEHRTCKYGCCGFLAHMSKHKRLKHRARQIAKKNLNRDLLSS